MWVDLEHDGKRFTVINRGDKFCSGGKQDICARDGFKSKAQVLRLVKKYKELL